MQIYPIIFSFFAVEYASARSLSTAAGPTALQQATHNDPNNPKVPITRDARGRRWRYLRVRVAGPNLKNTYVLPVCAWEFYGALYQAT